MERLAAATVRFLSSLTFGGMLGGGIAGLAHSWLLSGVPEVAFGQVLLSGILIGSALHKPLAWSWRQFLGPIAELGTSMIQVRKLRYYAERGLIAPDQFKDLVGKVIEDDIRGQDVPKALPPA